MSAVQAPTVLIMAAGTGGHVFPALTIAQELRARGANVEWLGTKAGLEARVVGKEGIRLHFIKIAGLRGGSLLRKISAPFTMLIALFQSLKLMKQLDPCCVLGMGGYVTGPGGLAARLSGRKLLIHEQNAVAGLANRLLYPIADTVMEAFPGAFGRSATKLKHVGNPVRANILAIPGPEQRLRGKAAHPRLLVIGGSLGAQVFNSILPAALALLPESERPLVKHQCGRGKHDATLEAYAKAGITVGDSVQVTEFIEDMAAEYASADLVLCRAGASTLAEICAIGIPSLLVPYPHATDGHQAANAAHLAMLGAACVLAQDALTATTLGEQLRVLLKDHARRMQLAQASRATATRDAAMRAASLCMEACHG